MKRPAVGIHLLLILLAVLVISSQPVCAKSETEGKWNIVADQISYDQGGDQFIAEGDVVITSEDKKLTADFARYDKKNKTIYSEGNVILIAGKDILKGDKMEIDVDRETGVIVNGSIFMKSTQFTIKADKINKIGENTYSAENGSISTCEGDDPDWRINGSYIEVTLEGYGYVKHAALYVRKLPVLYSPFIYFPAKTKRQSGFLVPEFGYSDRKGTELNLPYFWAINRNSDATLYSHSMSERGQKFGAEYRYILQNKTMGTAMFDFLNDNKIDDGTEATGDWGYGDSGSTQITRENSDRYWFRMKHNHSFRGGVEAKIDLDIVSDQDYLNEFKAGHSGLEKTDEYYLEAFGRGVDEYDESTRENKLTVSKGWTTYSLNVGAMWNDNVIARRLDGTDNTLQKMPFVEFDAKKTKLGDTPFYYNLESGYNYFYRISGTKGNRVDVYPRIYLPYSFENYFVFEPSVGLRETAWHINEYQNPDDDNEDYLHREIYDVELDLSSEVYNIFNTEFFGIDKIKHSIRPQAVYTFIPDIGTEDNPYFDSIDSIDETSEITYSISNYFTSRSERTVFNQGPKSSGNDSSTGSDSMDRPAYDYREFCRFKLSQTYDIKAAWENDPEPFSPIKGELDLSPIKYLIISGEAQYSRYSTRFVSYNASAEISDSRGDKLMVERRYKETGPTETIKLGFHLVMTDRLFAYGGNEYNFEDKINVETELGMVYTAQCWSTGVSFYDSEDEQRYRFTVNLTGLGELGHSVEY
jgi:LPS-assembly protein